MLIKDLNTPFSIKKMLMYGPDGNKVVCHNVNCQLIFDNIYKGETTKNQWDGNVADIFIYFDEIGYGIKIEHELYIRDDVTVELWKSRIFPCLTMKDYISTTEATMNRGGWVGNLDVKLISFFDPDEAQKAAMYRAEYRAKQEEKDNQRIKEQLQKEVEEAAVKEAEKNAKRAELLGWADGMPNMKFGKVYESLQKKYRYECGVMTRLQHVIWAIKNGMEPSVKSGAVSYYHGKMSNPKTEYWLAKDNLGTVITKTEYDFAMYLMNNKDKLAA